MNDVLKDVKMTRFNYLYVNKCPHLNKDKNVEVVLFNHRLATPLCKIR